MLESAKTFTGKKCIVYTAGGEQVAGTLTEVGDGWLLIDDGKTRDIINLDYVVRLREYPTDKKGKPKSVVLD